MISLHSSMLVVAVTALICIIVSFLGIVGTWGNAPAAADDYDNPYLLWFLIGAVVLLLDGAVFAVATLWDIDRMHIAAIAAAGLIVGSTLIFMRRVGLMPANWSSKPADPAVTPTKKPWLSKTILFNSGVAALLVAEANISSLQGFLPDSKYQIVAFCLPIVNMLLRVYTTQGLSLKRFVPQPGEAEC